MSLLDKLVFSAFCLLTVNCSAQHQSQPAASIQTGAMQTALYMPTLQGKRVGLVVNHTSTIGKTHLVDSLLARGIIIKTIFAPEHGFRGQATDGEEVGSARDSRTGIMLTSLYGKNRKPTPQQMDSLDVIVFDIQDVGTRFYTYISTMHYVMEACAENNKPLLILDRPNPNGHIIDGPILDPKFKSFVGMHPIPTVHGLTVGELARMINGEGWLASLDPSRPGPSRPGTSPGKTCPLTVVPVKNYTHQTPYELPIAPSPNLPNQQAILLYPSICFFEGTVVSIGRGTDKQFQVIGSPYTKYGPYQFTPVDKPGAIDPPLEGQLCYGLDLSGAKVSRQGIMLNYIVDFYNRATDKARFFLATNYIDRLYGSDQLRLQLKAGVSEAGIRKSWQPALAGYREMRKKYLLYP